MFAYKNAEQRPIPIDDMASNSSTHRWRCRVSLGDCYDLAILVCFLHDQPLYRSVGRIGVHRRPWTLLGSTLCREPIILVLDPGNLLIESTCRHIWQTLTTLEVPLVFLPTNIKALRAEDRK